MSVDPYWSSVVALAQFQAANQSTTFPDDKTGDTYTASWWIVRNFTPLYGATHGDSDAGYTAHRPFSANLNGFGYGATWTIDSWFWCGTSINTFYPICAIGGSTGTNPLVLYLYMSTTTASLVLSSQGVGTTAVNGNRSWSSVLSLPATAGWRHVQISSVSNGDYYVFVGGVLVGTLYTGNTALTAVSKNSSSYGIDLFSRSFGSIETYKRLQMVRATLGVVRNTTDFTPDNTLITAPEPSIYLPYVYA